MTGVGMRRLAGLLVFVAVWMPGAVRADWTEWLLDNERVVRAVMPDAGYVYGAATKDVLTYGGGVEWMPGDWLGWGLEYRQAQVRQARGRRGTAHAVGVKAYAETPAVWRVSLRTEIGAGAVLGESDAVKVDPSWAASARLGVRWRLSNWISALAWAGAVQTGRINTNEGYFLPKLMPDCGVGVAVGL